MRETLRLLAETGLKVLDIEAVWLNPDTIPEDCVPGFEAAGRLGARVIQAIGNDPDEDRLADTYAALCTAAVPFGLTVDLEFMAFAHTSSLAEARRVLAKASPANGGLLIDCLHLTRCGTAIDELRAVDAGLIHLLQLCDGAKEAPIGREAMIEEARFRRLLPGEGAFDLEGIWAALPAKIDLSIETPLGPRGKGLSFVERARRIKASADAFLARVGPPGQGRSQAARGTS
jgi:sugar phosphate isomerase/epimerase